MYMFDRMTSATLVCLWWKEYHEMEEEKSDPTWMMDIDEVSPCYLSGPTPWYLTRHSFIRTHNLQHIYLLSFAWKCHFNLWWKCGLFYHSVLVYGYMTIWNIITFGLVCGNKYKDAYIRTRYQYMMYKCIRSGKCKNL